MSGDFSDFLVGGPLTRFGGQLSASSGRSPERAYLKVMVSGQDMTAKLRPFLISCTAIDKQNEFDECNIELDDSYGQLALPPDRAPINILMGWHGGAISQVFSGVVSSVESGFSRSGGGGRRMWVDGKGADVTGMGKTPQHVTMGEGDPTGEDKGEKIPLTDIMQKVGQLAGFAVRVDPTLGALKRAFWSVDEESFFHFGQRMASELGGVFKVDGTNASLSSATGFTDALGGATGSVTAEWGINLMTWRIKPWSGRPQISKAQGEFFDKFKSIWSKNEKEVPGSTGVFSAAAVYLNRYQGNSKDQSEQQPMGPAADSESKRGTGWVIINGEPLARAGAQCTIKGARPGVDGSWRIVEAEHSWNRGEGYTTRLNLEQPQGGVGVDTRPEAVQWGE